MNKSVLIVILMYVLALAIKAEHIPIVTNTTPQYDVEKDRYIGTIEVFYDTETNTIEVAGDSNIGAEVYLYDSVNNELSHSLSINSTIPIPSHGTYTIYIIGDGWYTEAKIET